MGKTEFIYRKVSERKYRMKSLKFNLMFLGAATLIFCLAAEGSAQTRYHRRYNTPTNRRIERGIRSGQLTRGEVGKIREERRELRQERRAYLSDGRLSPGERRDLRDDRRKLNRLIQRSKYDRDRRYHR
jgi:hypothetical protein